MIGERSEEKKRGRGKEEKWILREEGEIGSFWWFSYVLFNKIVLIFFYCNVCEEVKYRYWILLLILLDVILMFWFSDNIVEFYIGVCI